MKNFDVDDVATRLNLTTAENISAQKFLLENKLNCVESTSCGRIFDAVSAVLGICTVATYEGEAAMKLQAVAENSQRPIPTTRPMTTSALFDEILTRRLEGYDVGALAKFFHEGLAEIVASTCGVKGLRKRGFKVLLNKMIPPNDGGICIGQAAFVNGG